MLLFTFILALVPMSKVPYFSCIHQDTFGSDKLKYFKTQEVSLTKGFEVVSRRLLASNCLSVHDLETPLRSCHFQVFVREPKPFRQLPQMSAPQQRPGLNMILIATNSLSCGIAANGSSFYRQVSTIM